MNREEFEERAVVLLNATCKLLKKQKNSYYVLNMLTETVEYDDAECDGSCLMEDIDNLLSEWEQ